MNVFGFKKEECFNFIKDFGAGEENKTQCPAGYK